MVKLKWETSPGAETHIFEKAYQKRRKFFFEVRTPDEVGF